MNHIEVVPEVSRVAPLSCGVAATGKGRPNPLTIRAVPSCAALFWGVFSLAAFGQPAATFVGGIIRDSSSGKPVPEVQVTAHNLNKRTDLATVSDTDGVFTFTNLEPGPYEFEGMKEGFLKSSARAQVGDRQVVGVDLPLQLAVD